MYGGRYLGDVGDACAPRDLVKSIISKSVKVSGSVACARQPRETQKAHANSLKNGLRNGSMACPKNPAPERWEGGPAHPIPCNPRDISRGLHGIGGVAVSDHVNIPMLTCKE